ncbi:MAG: hypothetical protein QOE47_2201 [Pyrinomonadaceae bacterium]|nr:hypothetical protein [Pyrinomonadaceae bacterium]
MKELGNSLAQLIFVIMVMITLAVSTAALSQWASPEEQGNTSSPTLSASATP